MHIWIVSYIINRLALIGRKYDGIAHVYFCLVDHYEPFWNNADKIIAENRVNKWIETYEKITRDHQDSKGETPKHSFFYPYEEYDEDIINKLGNLCERGNGDIEIHLHHDNDTRENLRSTLNEYKSILNKKHNILHKSKKNKKIEYCFIHGNWALDNSRPDGRWCGVDNELQVLVETGCVCDMTMPSAPSDTQTRKINSIYFAKGRPGKRKSHNKGRNTVEGKWKERGELLMIQGPLMLNWHKRKWGLLPKIETGEISADAPVTPERIALWLKSRIGIKGVNNHIFIKVHTHGAEDRTSEYLLNKGLNDLWTELEAQIREKKGFDLHYVTAWQMYMKVKEICTQSTIQ